MQLASARAVVDLPRRLGAEFIATAFLLATVVGSGIMAGRLSGGNTALALLANALATGAMLPLLILVFGPIPGARMKPAVTAMLAHPMFDLPLCQVKLPARAAEPAPGSPKPWRWPAL